MAARKPEPWTYGQAAQKPGPKRPTLSWLRTHTYEQTKQKNRRAKSPLGHWNSAFSLPRGGWIIWNQLGLWGSIAAQCVLFWNSWLVGSETKAFLLVCCTAHLTYGESWGRPAFLAPVHPDPERQTEARGSGRSGSCRVSEIPDLEGLSYLLWKCLIPFLWTFLEGFLLFQSPDFLFVTKFKFQRGKQPICVIISSCTKWN